MTYTFNDTIKIDQANTSIKAYLNISKSLLALKFKLTNTLIKAYLHISQSLLSF